MSKILRQKDILKFTQKSDKILENRIKKYTTQTPILNKMRKQINRTPKEQINKLHQIYNKHYPKQVDKQDEIVAKHLRNVPTLIKKDLLYKGPMQIQQKLLHTDYIEQDMGFSMWKDNLQKIKSFNRPFDNYKSLMYARADYQYINKLSHHNPDFAMMDTRLASLNGGHTSQLPSKFYHHNLKYDSKENVRFVRIEQAYIKKYKQNLVKNMKGKTIIKDGLDSLVKGDVDKNKTYKLSSWKVSKAQSTINNPKQIFGYANGMANVDTSKALTELTSSAKISPVLNYTVKTNVINHHLLPKQVVIDTLQSNGLNHQATIVKTKAPNWLQRQKGGLITTPQTDVVKNVAHDSWIQYKGIKGFVNQYENNKNMNMNNVLQQAGINPPSDKTKTSNKKHNINTSQKHVFNKHHKETKQLSPQQQKEFKTNINHIER